MIISAIVLLALAMLSQFFVISGIKVDPGVNKDSRNVINIFLTASLIFTTFAVIAVILL